MNHTTTPALYRALAASLLLHATVFAFGAQLLANLPKIARPGAATLKVRLIEPETVQLAAPAPQPELRMPEDTPAAVAPAVKRVPGPVEKRSAPVIATPPRAVSPTGVQMIAGIAARRAHEQIERELFYPPEAIERGLEGEVLVLLFLDASGNAIAARIETSSGHPLLDQAAVRAARTLRSLPGSAPREALLPVRFRLR